MKTTILSRLLLLLLSCGLLISLGCDDDDNEEEMTTEESADGEAGTEGGEAAEGTNAVSATVTDLMLEGNWNLSVTPDGALQSIAFVMDLVQNGGDITGTTNAGDSIAGVADENDVGLNLTNGAYVLSLVGIASNNSMSGRYQDTDGSTGNWSASR